jgi:hypothetical protein
MSIAFFIALKFMRNKSKMKKQASQTGSNPEQQDALSLRRIFKKKTDVQSVTSTVVGAITELANGSKKIDMADHQGAGEMVYVMINKGVVMTLHIQEFEPVPENSGRKAV